MIKRKETLSSIISETFLGGEGSIERTPLMPAEDFYGKGRLFARMRIPAGSSIGTHKHDGEQEIITILSGTGEVLDQGEWLPIGPGDVAICPSGAEHGIRNTGEADIEMIALILFTD